MWFFLSRCALVSNVSVAFERRLLYHTRKMTGYNEEALIPGAGDAQKVEAIDAFKNGDTAKLIDMKAMASMFSPDGLQGKLPANWLPRTLGALQRGVGRVGAVAGLSSLGTLGFLWNRHRFREHFNNELDKMASYTVEVLHLDGGMTKCASSGLQEVKAIMRKVYEEDPSFWPYGLDVPGHESVYLIRDNMTKAAAGFVGWQEQRIGGRKVGSYSIGILPEFRSKGFAKEAVAKIIREKSARVDEVRSYVCPHNVKSKGLASSLGIKVHEEF